MKTLKKVSILSLGALTVLGLAACGGQKETPYERGSDEEIYAATLGKFETKANAAKGIANDDERFVVYAQAEAELLNAGVMVPTTTQGGTYAITRVAPRTIPYANWGNDDDRLYEMVVCNFDANKPFITSAQRVEMINAWKAARAGEGTYDPKAYLQDKGFTIANKYATTYSTAPATLDILNTSEQSDTEVLVNCIDGLLQYNNLGALCGNIALTNEETGLPYSISEDGKTYTFNLRTDAEWYTADGTKYADVVADDFVAGFQHMLDAQAGLEFLVQGIVKGADEYLSGGKWDDVGVKAVDEHTFQMELCAPESFFPTRLTYSCFMPLNRAFFVSKGGAFGIEEYKTASAKEEYTFGNVGSNANQLYNGAFIPSSIVEKSNITLTRNSKYFGNSKNNFDELKWVYDDGSQPDNLYTATCAGDYAGIGLGVASGLLEKAKKDGNFDKYHYVVDTTTTTYMAGLNTNRGTFETGSVKSSQTETQKTATHAAMQNVKFRKALIHAWDRASWNAVTAGEDLKLNALRNMYTKPDFLNLSKAVTDADGHEFAQGTSYGDMVQYYCDKLGMGITVADGCDGWFNAAKAQQLASQAKAELEEAGAWKGKVIIDVTYYGASKSQTANANSYKQLIEAVLGDYVEVKLNNAETTADFYACGYRAPSGEAGNFDVFYGSGWGPDYGDPSTYLDTFLGGGAGYMTKICGLF